MVNKVDRWTILIILMVVVVLGTDFCVPLCKLCDIDNENKKVVFVV